MFIIISGKQTTDEGPYTPLDEVSSRLQRKGAAVFVLGVGKEVDPLELSKIASASDNVFRVDSFEDLDDKANSIKRGICKLGIVCICLFQDTNVYNDTGSQGECYMSIKIIVCLGEICWTIRSLL